MERCWALLLGVAVVAAVAPAGRAAPPALAYPQALAQAVDAFNRRPEARSAFRLLSAEPEPTPDVQLSSLRGLNLTLMETECEAGSRTPLEDCDFKENGAIKDCAGSVQLQEGSPELDLRCVDASADPVLVQRGRIGRFFGRLRRFRPVVRFDIRARGQIRLG